MTSLIKNPVVLGALIVIVMAAAAAVFLLWRTRSKSSGVASEPAAPAAAEVDANQVAALFRDAANRLKGSPALKGSSFAILPVFLVAGPRGAGKTSAVEHCGLSPELLAGQVYQGSSVLPTRDLNIWLAGGAVFIELADSIALDETALKTVLKHLAPGRLAAGFKRAQPPRGIVLCVDQAPISAAATPGDILALARPWNRFLSITASALGVQLPAYELLTKTDGIATFADFAAHLRSNDLPQAVGATIRPFASSGPGVYAQDTARVLTERFAAVAYSLSDARLALLNREHDRARVAQAYQFPRDFGQLQKNVVQFLVEVARPSSLEVSPFLRGFYFSGTRVVAVEGSDAPALPMEQAALDVGHFAYTDHAARGGRAARLDSRANAEQREASHGMAFRQCFVCPGGPD